MGTTTWTSWNGRIKRPHQGYLSNNNLDELAQAVAKADKVRALGYGKSSADIVASSGYNIPSSVLSKPAYLNGERNIVTAGAGLSLAQLCVYLEQNGLAFAALPDIDEITLAGAVSTGTHGTGRQALSLSDYLTEVTLIDAQGQTVVVNQSSDLYASLDALRVSLGLLGIMTQVSFRVEALKQLALVEKAMPDSEWLASMDDNYQSYDFLRMLWLPHTNKAWVIKGQPFSDRPPFEPLDPPVFNRYRRLWSKRLYALAGVIPSSVPCSNRLLQRTFFSKEVRRIGSLYQSTVTKSRSGTLELAEWTIDRRDFAACFKELKQAFEREKSWTHIPMDIRFIKKSKAWLGNAQSEECVTMGCVTRNPATADSYKSFDVMERVFLNHGARPHWAKRFKASPETLSKLYPRYHDFVKLRRSLDPQGKFLNDYLAPYFE